MTKITGRATWTPPPRVEWVQRINDEGRGMDVRSIVPLDADSLLRTAEKNTGLSDYGNDAWREPFEIITRALDEEAELTLMGRLMTRSDMLMFLEGRLRIEDEYKRHPEIEDEKIVKPLIVVGQGRSGTSALLNILSCDPDSGSVKTWEAMLPCPPPEKATYGTDPRIKAADTLITQWNRVVPSIQSIHEFGGHIPASCVHFMCFSFISIWFGMLGQMPSYSAYLKRADWNASFEYHKRLLKLLQWKNPRKLWVLKSPTHLTQMPALLRVYPDACFVWPHRDPIKAVVSSTSLTGNLNWMRSDQVRLAGFEEYNKPELAVDMLNRPIDWLEKGVVPKERLCNIMYLDLLKDPVGTVAKIYAYFDLDLTPAARAAMDRYMEESPRSARPAHDYDVGPKELIAQERQMFARYQNYFNVPSEL